MHWAWLLSEHTEHLLSDAQLNTHTSPSQRCVMTGGTNLNCLDYSFSLLICSISSCLFSFLILQRSPQTPSPGFLLRPAALSTTWTLFRWRRDGRKWHHFRLHRIVLSKLSETMVLWMTINNDNKKTNNNNNIRHCLICYFKILLKYLMFWLVAISV